MEQLLHKAGNQLYCIYEWVTWGRDHVMALMVWSGMVLPSYAWYFTYDKITLFILI